MEGPSILVQTLTVPAFTRTASPQPWQYHSRGGRHSLTACWGVMFDLLANSSLLREHVLSGKVVFGLDHQMHDYAANRSKNLDLVVARPHDGGWTRKRRPRLFAELPALFDMHLNDDQRSALASLPNPLEGAVGAVHLALEAKACMTAFSKSYPRLYDELNSSHAVIHGASNRALAVGLAIINVADEFVSPVGIRNRHDQPAGALGAIAKVGQLPRRSGDEGVGYDGLGIVLVDLTNDGSPVTLASSPPVPVNYEYERMVVRIANEYDVRFRNA
ncbi:MAG TPA: hypothetical protein VM942_03130 [Acidimicrobiales bacterium]|nr:hypothetical protein [Acidimicrobiales bacterium]